MIGCHLSPKQLWSHSWLYFLFNWTTTLMASGIVRDRRWQMHTYEGWRCIMRMKADWPRGDHATAWPFHANNSFLLSSPHQTFCNNLSSFSFLHLQLSSFKRIYVHWMKSCCPRCTITLSQRLAWFSFSQEGVLPSRRVCSSECTRWMHFTDNNAPVHAHTQTTQWILVSWHCVILCCIKNDIFFFKWMNHPR